MLLVLAGLGFRLVLVLVLMLVMRNARESWVDVSLRAEEDLGSPIVNHRNGIALAHYPF